MNWATLIFLTQSFDSKIAFNFLLFWHFQVIRVGDKHFLSSLCPRLHSLHSLEENILSRNVSSITTMHFHETHFTDYNLATCVCSEGLQITCLQWDHDFKTMYWVGTVPWHLEIVLLSSVTLFSLNRCQVLFVGALVNVWLAFHIIAPAFFSGFEKKE